MNSLFTIRPYKINNTWVFDDKSRGLQKEPFVSGIPEIIEHIIGKNKQFTCIFSSSKFPSSNTKLTRLKEEYGGNWYKLDNTDLTGWLCPALFKYFDTAPDHIYLEIKV